MRWNDVTVARNALREGSVIELKRIVVMFLDFAVDQAQRKKQQRAGEVASRRRFARSSCIDP
jgi:hypothetical protein